MRWLRYLNHVRLDLEILSGVAHESRSLAALLEDEPHPEAHTALLHLGEIETLANNALAVLEGRPDDASMRQRLAPVSGQMRMHETGALDALNRIIEDRNRKIVATLQQTLGLLILIALVVALLGCLVLWVFYRRIRQPLRHVAEGVRRFGEGDESVRLAVNGGDELSDVTRLFNQAMDQRAAYQLQLQEHIKQQRCLYRVLELTTDENLSVAEVCREIAQLIPAQMLHADAGIARVRCEVETYTSNNWAEPRALIYSPIRISDEEIGCVEAGYSRELPDQPGGEGPFLAEERTLLDSIAMHLARMLQDRRLRDALARSQRLQAVGSLTGGIAHDFNNLLTVIQGNAELLCDMYTDHDPEAAELAGMIDSAAQRGAALTHRLLAFARRQALEPRAVDVNRLIEDMRGLLQRTLGAQVALELKLGDDLWPALVDPAQLETGLLNLIVNARDAMPEGGRLTLETANVALDADFAETRHEVTPGDFVRVTVSDTGTGMASEVLERAFEPFFTTKPKDRGTGLGLSMVYGFVKQSAGHVAVYSEPDQGCTVRLYLPRAREAAARVEKPGIASIPRGGAHVLLVEDDDLVRRYTRDQLAALGYRVQAAADGFEAQSILKSDQAFNLLLTDIVMPGGMSGRDLATIAVELQPGLKVLYMSGYTENAIVHHGRLDPGVSLLSKPFRRADLARKVQEVLTGEDNLKGDAL
ncbi:MAG: response regulator [Xanthomonadaceae bacterium]|nr:response regulator [Xanthomonadaceae bacterium]